MHGSNQLQTRSPRVVVLGIGNTLMRDDGAGIHVARNLQRSQALLRSPSGNIDIIDGGTLGYLLIDRVSGADAMVIIDAANLRAPPGTVQVFDDSGIEVYLEENPSSSVHEVGLIDLLQMMALSQSQPRIRALVGIQPGIVDWGTEMSAEVHDSIGAASAAVETIVAGWLERGDL